MASVSLDSLAASVRLAATLQNSFDGGVVTPDVDLGKTVSPATELATGTGANQANRFWQKTGLAVGNSANVDLDVFDFAGQDVGAGAGNDALGQAMALTRIVGIIIYNNPATSLGDILIGGEGTGAAWSSIFNAVDTTKIGPFPPGAWFMAFNPAAAAFAVADATNHLLRLTENGVGDAVVDVYILGSQ